MNPDSRASAGGLTKSALLGVALIAVSVSVLAWNYKWMQEVYEGPTPMEVEHLLLVSDPARLSNQWVTIPVEKSVETGIEVVSSRSQKVRSRYVLIQVKKAWMVAEVKNGPVPKQLSGYLSVWQTPFAKNALVQITGRTKNAKLLPFQFDSEYDQSVQCYAMLAVMGFFLFFGVFVLVASIFAMRSPALAAPSAHEALAATAFRYR